MNRPRTSRSSDQSRPTLRLASAILALGVMACSGSHEPQLFCSNARDHEPQPVQLIEYSDFACPFAEAGQPIIERVLAVFGEAVAYEYRHFFLDNDASSELAARLYEAVRDADEEMATRFRRRLFMNQERLETEDIEYLEDLLRELGLDPQALTIESYAPAIGARLANHAEQAQGLGMQGTPNYVIAGQVFRGTKSFAEFEAAICEALLLEYDLSTKGTYEAIELCWRLVRPDWQRLSELERAERDP